MIDHVTIGVANLDRAKAFYDGALKPLGIERLYAEGTAFTGYGRDHKAFFWIGARGAERSSVHVAFAVTSRTVVDAFHAAALSCGGRDNGAPGLRPQYDPSYYGAFVLDPDGNNIEAVCRSSS